MTVNVGPWSLNTLPFTYFAAGAKSSTREDLKVFKRQEKTRRKRRNQKREMWPMLECSMSKANPWKLSEGAYLIKPSPSLVPKHGFFLRPHGMQQNRFFFGGAGDFVVGISHGCRAKFLIFYLFFN